jgi:hypothetical protein
MAEIGINLAATIVLVSLITGGTCCFSIWREHQEAYDRDQEYVNRMTAMGHAYDKYMAALTAAALKKDTPNG